MEMIVLFLKGCQIMDSDFHEIWDEDSEQIKDTSVVIGNHVLVCSKVTILKGVKIGNNVIIAANSVVTRDVPNGCVAAGNPARIIKKMFIGHNTFNKKLNVCDRRKIL